jgi:hypothetical protein
MKKLFLLLLLLLCSLANAETYLGHGAVTYGTLGRALSWPSVGFNNTWVFDAINSGSGVCLTIQNNDTSGHQFSLAGYVTSDLSLTILGNASKWQQVALSPPATATGFTVQPSAVLQIYLKAPGAARIATAFSAGAGIGTVDLYFSQTGSSCGSVNQWTVVGSTAAQNVSILAAVPGVKHVLQCFTFSVSGNSLLATSNLQFTIRNNDVSGNCTGGSIQYIHTISFPAGSISKEFGLCDMNLAIGTNQNMVACFGTAVTGMVQDIFFSGYDSQ